MDVSCRSKVFGAAERQRCGTMSSFRCRPGGRKDPARMLLQCTNVKYKSSLWLILVAFVRFGSARVTSYG